MLALASSESWLPLLRPIIPIGWRLRLLQSFTDPWGMMAELADLYSGRLTHKVIIRPASSLAQDRESSPVKKSAFYHCVTPPITVPLWWKQIVFLNYWFHDIFFHLNANFTLMLTKRLQLLGTSPQTSYTRNLPLHPVGDSSPRRPAVPQPLRQIDAPLHVADNNCGTKNSIKP